MDFSLTDRQRHWRDRVRAFMAAHVYPNLQTYKDQIAGFGANRWQVVPIIEELKPKARAAGRVFQQQLDEVMREAGAADLKRQVDDAMRIDPERAIAQTVDPQGEINKIWTDASAIPDPGMIPTEAPGTFVPPAPGEEPVAELAPTDPTRLADSKPADKAP